ncbi:hypothetical protein BpHYR1_046091 [Brachionus plicatilis]|uniref:Uncharacterized protein n=1 Tax=Brachionus plicatilis TaxID=10195 RepID=A0A3M7Q453_BRAPC|nr:hypothetical protein BpHYR1_046091 [Brachionus plicatilis]
MIYFYLLHLIIKLLKAPNSLYSISNLLDKDEFMWVPFFGKIEMHYIGWLPTAPDILKALFLKIKRLKWCKERLNWTIERWGMEIKGFKKYDTRFVVPALQGGGRSAGIWNASAVKVHDAVVYVRGELINIPTRKR